MKALAAGLAVVLLTSAWGGKGQDAGACLAVDRTVARDTTLPRPVGRTETAVLRAAYACDYDELVRIADFDFTETDLAPLIALFEGPVVLDGAVYIWPGTKAGAGRTAISDDGTWQFYETAPPAEIVAVIGTNVVVVSSDDGSVVRTLADGQAGASTVAVSPDGQTVYFTRADPNVVCDEGQATQVVTVPTAGGSPEIFASGRDPVVSPDGKRIAYATSGADQCGPASQIAIQELDGQTFEQQLYPEATDAFPKRRLPVAWSPDSGTLLFRSFGMGAVSGGVTLDVRRQSTERTGIQNLQDASFRSARRLVVALQSSGDIFVSALPSEGRRRTLVETSSSIGSLDLDPSRRHIVFTSALHVWRWSEGGKPEQLLTSSAGDVVSAAWVPA